MQNVGIQTVLQMSNAAERVQSAEQSHTPLAAEQSKEAVEKAAMAKMETVNKTEESENAKIHEEDERRKQEQKKREEEQAEKMRAKGENEVSPPISASDTHGKLLNITV